MLVLTLNSPKLLRYSRLKLRFLFCFKCQLFKVFSDGLSYLEALLWFKSQKMQFLEGFSSFKNKIDKKKKKIKTFTYSSSHH